ncbi:MAG: PAC2 family protein [Candidatus Omnitrophica bacterium]|nr:PAC2 family protein [Candidatus Omnitrophota bacterium]
MKIYKKMDFSKPAMVAGWPGMGNVALGTVDYLKRKLGAVKFAQVMVDESFSLDSVVVEDGMAKLPAPPEYVFYYAKDANLIIFEGQAQLPGQGGMSLLNKVLDLALESKVTRIYTAAAFPSPVSHKDRAEVYGVANKRPLKDALLKSGVKIMEDGQVFGLNGLLLGFAEKRGIEAMCLLATMPHYAISLPNPKASAAIIEVLSKLLGFKIDLKEIEEYIAEMDAKMEIVEDKVKDVFAIGEGKADKREAPKRDKVVPGYIIEKIERLFQEARADKTKAVNLKNELDRWDLYKAYEDRFLDLFKENQ